MLAVHSLTRNRSFFKKPGEAKLGALPAALPSAGALSPVPAAAGGRKRLTVDEPRELIDLTEAGKAEPADKRARKDGTWIFRTKTFP